MTYALILAIMGTAFWRFRIVPLDRDFTPYTYPAVFNTGWLRGGHFDIKPPLIHWGFKCWLKITSFMQKRLGMVATIRALPYLGMTLACLLVERSAPGKGILLSLLFALPTLWAHMANTEWLTALLWALALAFPQAGWWMLGLSLLVNQKNLLLLAPVALALELKLEPTTLPALFTPILLAGAWLLLTGRLADARMACFVIPERFGKARTFRRNVLGHLPVLAPGIPFIALFLAVGEGPWLAVALVTIAVMLWSKQIVPHHLLLLAFPLALAAEPSVGLFLGYALLFAQKDLLAWLKPGYTYNLTFPGYQGAFLDGDEIAEWIDKNLEPGEAFWINGWENHLHIQTLRPSVRLSVPETQDAPETMPRVIVHCVGAVKVDYDAHGYKLALTSRFGGYSVMVRP